MSIIDLLDLLDPREKSLPNTGLVDLVGIPSDGIVVKGDMEVDRFSVEWLLRDGLNGSFPLAVGSTEFDVVLVGDWV